MPLECYLLIFGPIACSEKEKEEWEESMKERTKKNGEEFKSEENPKADMNGAKGSKDTRGMR
jgi:hypothetical protein